TLASANYADWTFYYNYVVSVSVPDGSWGDSIRDTWCKNPSMKWMFEVGLSIRGVYTSSSGAPIATVVADKKTCGST
ncbi:hypothetical protein KC217_22730, partial [Mycobacterium tuberculosis]|nr:hypothetical protein [Mycobacterium tuberculosis]